MPVEIRELKIQTTVNQVANRQEAGLSSSELDALRQQLVQECLKTLQAKLRQHPYQR